MKFTKSQWLQIKQPEAFLGKILEPLVKTGIPVIKNLLEPLAKCVLIPLGSTAAASVADAGAQKKIFVSEK